MKLRLEDFPDDEDDAAHAVELPPESLARFHAGLRKLVAMKKRLGICAKSVTCPRPARPGFVTCEACSQSKASYMRRSRRKVVE